MRRRLPPLILIILVVTAPAACADDNESSVMRLDDHPLADRIWSIRDRSVVDPERLLAQARASDYVLLGETHDNPLHHRHQAEVLNGLAARDRDARVVLEMFTESQARQLTGDRPATAEAFFDAVSWETSGWPARELYEPVIRTALDAGIPLYPGNLDREFLRSLIRQGAAALPPELRAYIDGNALDTRALNSMRDDVMKSHCDMLPDDMAEPMILGQRTRDAAMARALIENRNHAIAVLIAGSGHVRNDHGVPSYLSSREPDATIFTVAWMEVREDFTDPLEYAAVWNTDALPFDYVWFTPRVDRPDPCAELKARHGKPGH